MKVNVSGSDEGRSCKEAAFDTLFERIYDGKYRPGHRLKEVDIANEFGISRGSVRELLKQLEDIVLIEILPNRGAVVVGLSQDDIEEIYEIRKSLEILALKFALPRMRLNELSEFRSRVAELDENAPADKIAELDGALHRFIVDTSGRKHLKKMLERIYLLNLKIRKVAFQNPEGIKLARKEHLDLIDAIFHRDMAKAVPILLEHLERSKTVVLTTLFRRAAAKSS